MNEPEMIAYKNRLKRYAVDLIGRRITTSREAIDQAQQSANSEEKSSAGDKYETGRAMGHLQKDMHSRQLAESIKELAALHAVNIEILYPQVMAGAYVRAEGVDFFIFAGLGKQVVDGRLVFFLSPQAPLAQMLQNKKTGDRVVFNGRIHPILEIF